MGGGGNRPTRRRVGCIAVRSEEFVPAFQPGSQSPVGRRLALPALLLPWLVAASAAAGAELKPRLHGERSEVARPSLIRRPTWGKVSGWVLDAATRKPIPGARVSVELDGAFPEKGRGTAATDRGGRYQARAPLGEVSTRFDWGRLLSMHPVSILLSPRSLTKQTRLLEVTQANVRVEAPGYRRFLGRVRASRLDPASFAVILDDVWLAPEGARLASFSPDRLRLEVIEAFDVQPRVASPGELVTITLRARLPLARGYRYRAFVSSSAIRLVSDNLELKREEYSTHRPPDDEAGAGGTAVVFRRQVRLPRRSVDRWTRLGIVLRRDEATTLTSRETRTLLQMVESPAERRAAELVSAGFQRERIGDREGALREYAAARTACPAYVPAALFQGDAAYQAGRAQEAIDAYRHLANLDETDYAVARPRLALALVRQGRVDEAREALAGAERVSGSRGVPAEVSLVRARILAEQGDIAAADEWLARAGKEVQIPAEIVQVLTLRRLELAIRERPEDAELRMSYGRELAAAEREEAALTQLRRAAELSPESPWPFLELGIALRRRGRDAEGLAQLEHAHALDRENLEVSLALADAYRDAGRWAEAGALYAGAAARQQFNLRARHHHALMLYATGRLEEARAELAEVIHQARDKGDLIEEGLLIPGASIYIGPKRRLVYGFSVPEAAADLTLLEALEDLRRNPDNGLLWQNIGAALLDLQLPALALPALQKAWQHDDSLLETRFLLGLAYRRLGQPGPARDELRAVIAANPLHPHARIELAQLYTDEGNFDAAQAELLAHARNYPFERPARPALRLGG